MSSTQAVQPWFATNYAQKGLFPGIIATSARSESLEVEHVLRQAAATTGLGAVLMSTRARHGTVICLKRLERTLSW